MSSAMPLALYGLPCSLRIQGPATVDPPGPTIRTYDPELHVETSLAGQPPHVGGNHMAPVFRMDRLEPEIGVAIEIAHRTAPDLLVPRADVQRSPRLDRLDPEDLRN